ATIAKRKWPVFQRIIRDSVLDRTFDQPSKQSVQQLLRSSPPVARTEFFGDEWPTVGKLGRASLHQIQASASAKAAGSLFGTAVDRGSGHLLVVALGASKNAPRESAAAANERAELRSTPSHN